MEPHPVPKNILTVEFKLFGSLSVRQFFKVLAACAVGLLIFALPIPKIVTIPTILIVVGLGVLAALIPSFQVRLFGFLKALFVSPQYVWKKSDKAPSVLQKTPEVKASSTSISKVEKMNAAPSLGRLNIDQLIDAKNIARGEPDLEEDDLDISSNTSGGFARYYEQEFAVPKPARGRGVLAAGNKDNYEAEKAPKPIFDASLSQNSQAGLENSAANAVSAAGASASSSAQQQTNNAANNSTQAAANFDAAKKVAGDMLPENTEAPKKYIYGIVVDAKEVAVSAATVILLDSRGQQVEPQTLSGSDGRFFLDITGLEFGSYVMRILHPRFAFYDFRVNYDQNKLPAYKFKARQ